MSKKKTRKKQKILDYKNLFEVLPPREFLGTIFFGHNFTRFYCLKYKYDFKSRWPRVNQVFNYIHEDDLYNYFKINHQFHKDKSKFDYINTLFVLMSDLISQTPDIEFVPLSDIPSKPTFISYSKSNPQITNMARDFFYYHDKDGIIRKEKMNFYDYKEVLKEIYQKELLPIDISQLSYLG